ncbi:MAG: hypothetical protein JWO48_2370, partial [Bryobacterales bacterium]|nr:hypothetical protein [Bryobacterales bacterium]
MSSAAVPVPYRARPSVREHEILRVSALLAGDNSENAIGVARKAVLHWAKNKTTGKLPDEAWREQSFEHISGGRNCSAVRLVDGADD